MGKARMTEVGHDRALREQAGQAYSFSGSGEDIVEIIHTVSPRGGE